MKKYILYITLVFFFANCKKSDINLIPISSSSADGFYKSSQDIINAINATYGTLQSGAAAANEFMFGDLPTDDAQAVPALFAQGHGDFDNYTSSTTSSNAGQVDSRWTACYSGIQRANAILDRIGAITMDATLKARVIGEAKFLRAYYYFNLVKVFGDVPLILQEITATQAYTYGRDPAASVYAQIQKDFTDAAAALPASYTGTDVGRATSGAANGLLARVMLMQKNFSQATPLLLGIINSNQYSLLPNYGDVFKAANNNNKEILFAVQYTASSVATGQNNSTNVSTFNPVTGVAVSLIGYSSTNADQPTQDIYDAYQANDPRRTVNIAYATVAGLPSAYCSKYITPSITTIGENGTDYPVLRYADVLLMYGECLNEAGDLAGAIAQVNKVRERAFGNATQDFQTTDNTNTVTYVASQADMRDKIMNERRLELCFEGLRFFDLIRTDRLLPVMNAYFVKYNLQVNGGIISIGANNELFPVPQAEINLNPTKITQNPGYQ